MLHIIFGDHRTGSSDDFEPPRLGFPAARAPAECRRAAGPGQSLVTARGADCGAERIAAEMIGYSGAFHQRRLAVLAQVAPHISKMSIGSEERSIVPAQVIRAAPALRCKVRGRVGVVRAAPENVNPRAPMPGGELLRLYRDIERARRTGRVVRIPSSPSACGADRGPLPWPRSLVRTHCPAVGPKVVAAAGDRAPILDQHSKHAVTERAYRLRRSEDPPEASGRVNAASPPM